MDRFCAWMTTYVPRMVSSSHEAMHRIFQKDPGIFSRTLGRLGVPFPEPAEVSLLTPDLTEIKPLERRVDTLLRIDTKDNGSYLLIVEAQGKKDLAKHSSWAYYVSYLYAKYDLPPLLLVVCQDSGTARWAQAPFNVGPPEWDTLTVRPLVLGPNNMPIILDPATAADDIPMAAFAAITHSSNPNADTMLEALATALKTVDEDTIAVFGELTELGLGTSPAAETWRKLMAIPTSYFRSETSQRLRTEGRVEGRAEDVLFVLRTRRVEADDATRARVRECTDPDLLQTWLGRALTVERAQDIFKDPAEG
jgi:hypothetical protein